MKRILSIIDDNRWDPQSPWKSEQTVPCRNEKGEVFYCSCFSLQND